MESPPGSPVLKVRVSPKDKVTDGGEMNWLAPFCPKCETCDIKPMPYGLGHVATYTQFVCDLDVIERFPALTFKEAQALT